VGFAFGIAMVASTVARADTCPAPKEADAKLATIDARARIDFLHHTLDSQAHYANLWKWWWFGIGSATFATSAAQVVGWAAGNDVTRDANIIDNLVVSGFSIVTPITALLFALRVESDAPAVDALLRQTNDGAAGTCLVLARIEELFAKGAAEEALNTGVLSQILAFVGLGAMFSIMAVEAATSPHGPIQDVHWANAITNTGVGIILTEAQILTTPTGAASAYKRYLKGDLPRRTKMSLSIVPMREAPGISLRLTFQ
jgi:hypothetical protein